MSEEAVKVPAGVPVLVLLSQAAMRGVVTHLFEAPEALSKCAEMDRRIKEEGYEALFAAGEIRNVKLAPPA